MLFYMAPMEGLTGYVFRNAYERYFGGIDCYFTPFLTNKKLSYKEINDVLPEHNQGMRVVPQILTNRVEDFLAIEKELELYGYKEVNLNLGCPSGTVVAKGRGAGALAQPEQLDTFLAEIFEKSPLKISIKTRVGIAAEEEWEQLLAIYEKYPLTELIIHPRVQKDFYKNTPRMETFYYAMKHSKHSLCYNGDIHSKEAYDKFLEDETKRGQGDGVEKIMLGRGILKHPMLVGQLRGDSTPNQIKETMRAYHDEILEGYAKVMSGDRNTLFRMKEFWSYFADSFVAPEKYLKQMKKAQRLSEYEVAVDGVFRACEINQEYV